MDMVEIDTATLRKSTDGRKQNVEGITLVAYFYDRKPAALAELIETVTTRMEEGLRQYAGLFGQYPLRQVHGTIVGLEGCRNPEGRVVSRNQSDRESRFGCKAEVMDFQGLLSFFSHHAWPVTFQFGGYSPESTNPYDPWVAPWKRTLDIRKDGLLVLMGWACLAEYKPFAPVLLGFRKFLEAHGIVHKYHINPSESDNDLFLVLGGLQADLWEQMPDEERAKVVALLSEVREGLRTLLAGRPVLVEMTMDDLRVVKYLRTTLEEFAFNSHLSEMNADSFQKLY